MTPKERTAAAMQGIMPDRLPIMAANSNTFICQYYGMSVEEFLTDADKCTTGNINFTEEFGIDYNLCINGYILYGCGPEIGCQWKQAGNDFPGFVSGPLETEQDLDKIRIPEKPTGYFAHYLEVIRRLNQALGQKYHLSVSILGPFAVACFLRGIQNALLDTIMNPGFVKKYMELCVDISIYLGRSILGTGLEHPILNEIFLTPQMIRPDTFHELIAPFDLEVQNALGPQNAPNSLSAFMGLPKDKESQKAGAALYKAFFTGTDSLDELKQAAAGRLPGMPIPVAISGPALDSASSGDLIDYLSPRLDFLVKEHGLYPSIMLASVQADSPQKARAIADKIQKIKAFRDEYAL